MSSPPTPTTSIKAASLSTSHQKHQRRPSFPLVTILNPFRKKAPPKRARSPSPVEPYEVAPGIWNTDATAKVFGYLEPDLKKGNSPSKSAGSEARNHGQILKRKPVAQRPSHNSTKKARVNTGADHAQGRERKVKTCIELPDKSSPDRAKGVKKPEEPPVQSPGKDKMRTVSKDDQLIQRGANPRTGLVSPFVVSDSSDDNLIGHDYVRVGKIQCDNQPLLKRRTHSGKWKQNGAGWSLVENPMLSPVAQSVNDPLSRNVSVKKLEDKLLVEMPGVDNPEPENMTDEQIRKYQESIAQAYKRGGGSAMVDPGTLPSPRQSTSEGPSTPPNKLQRIRRKMVGSGPTRREENNDTVVVNTQERASSVATPRKAEPPKVTSVTPSNIAKGPMKEQAPSAPTLSKDNVQPPKLKNKTQAISLKGCHWGSVQKNRRLPQRTIF